MVTDEMVDAARAALWNKGALPSHEDMRAALEAAERAAWRPIGKVLVSVPEINAEFEGVVIGVDEGWPVVQFKDGSKNAVRPSRVKPLPTPLENSNDQA